MNFYVVDLKTFCVAITLIRGLLSPYILFFRVMVVRTIHALGYTDVVQIDIYNQNISILFCSKCNFLVWRKKNYFSFVYISWYYTIPSRVLCLFPRCSHSSTQTQTQAAICSTYIYCVGPVRFLNKTILNSLKKLHS